MKGKWKESRKKKKGNEVLQKYMVAVGDFVKSKSGAEEEEAEDSRTLGFVKKKSRKELRKEKRKMKKIKMKHHYEGKKLISSPTDEGEHPDKQPQLQKMGKVKKEVSKTHSNKPTSAPTVKSENSKTPSSSKVTKKKTNTLKESRKMALLEANEQEDREIKKLERCLRINKRKNKKSLPQSFMADGLDYILGVLDSGSSAVGMYDSDEDMDAAKDNFEKLDENDTQLSDEDEEPGDEMASGGSDDDDDMGSSDEENDDDEIMNDEEADEEEMEDALDASDAADSDDENEGDTEEEADTPPDTKTSDSGTVSSQPKHLFQYSDYIDTLYV